MEPSQKDIEQLQKWNGKIIKLDLLHHEDYDLAMFVKGMENWNGEILSIGYSGPKIFTADVSSAFQNAKYKSVCFEKCELPYGFIDDIVKFAPNLNIIKQ